MPNFQETNASQFGCPETFRGNKFHGPRILDSRAHLLLATPQTGLYVNVIARVKQFCTPARKISSTEVLNIEVMVRGYHVYQEIASLSQLPISRCDGG